MSNREFLKRLIRQLEFAEMDLGGAAAEASPQNREKLDNAYGMMGKIISAVKEELMEVEDDECI